MIVGGLSLPSASNVYQNVIVHKRKVVVHLPRPVKNKVEKRAPHLHSRRNARKCRLHAWQTDHLKFKHNITSLTTP